MTSAYQGVFEEAFHDMLPINNWFPSEGCARAKNVAIGIIVGIGLFLAAGAVFHTLQTHYSWFSISQETIQIFNVFQNAHPLMDFAWRGLWRGYVVIGAPVLEEIMFRGLLNDKIELCQGEHPSRIKKIARIALVALIFGAMHLSPFQSSLTNFVLLSLTTTLGVAFGILRETRKDLSAPIAAHVMFNLAMTL